MPKQCPTVLLRVGISFFYAIIKGDTQSRLRKKKVIKHLGEF